MSEIPMKMLLVDDSEVDVEITLRALSKTKVKNECIVLYSGQACLDYILSQGEYADQKKNSRPDIILLDINMPKINGFEVLHELKTNSNSIEIPIIMFTNSSSYEDVVKSYKLGASTYFNKPATLKELVNMFNQFDAYWREVGKLPSHFSK